VNVVLRTPTERDRWIAFLAQQPLPVEVSVEPWSKPRTLPQNAFLWSAVYAPLVERAGFTPEDWHEFFCTAHFGGVPYVKPDGSIEIRPKRTTTRNEQGKRDVLKGKAFADFVTFVDSECASRGVFVTEEWQE
jgi:hypothetical protein